ncbi:hypothetical protein INN88_14930 [Staphylococcus aureus]|nr:hypothetical protein [Staphylococcus aureus]
MKQEKEKEKEKKKGTPEVGRIIVLLSICRTEFSFVRTRVCEKALSWLSEREIGGVLLCPAIVDLAVL